MWTLLAWSSELPLTVQEVLAAGRALATTSAVERTAPQEHKWVDHPLPGRRSEEIPAHGRLTPPSPNDQLPAHLGWQSNALTYSLRASAARQARRLAREEARNLDWLRELTPVVQGQTSGLDESIHLTNQRFVLKDAAVKLYPSLALGILRRNLAAVGRIWLLLRYLDRDHCGWIEEVEAVERLTGKDEPLRVCGRRQWRNLLKQGEGIFWQRGNGRLWLRSVGRVAAALGVERLVGRPVALPLEALTQGIGTVRAHFYASFHSGRASGRHEYGRPISRQTLQSLSKVSRRSQHAYEARLHLHARRNDAVGPAANLHNKKEQVWKHGKALYQLTDHQGCHGRPKATYFAWQLPNSYCGPHRLMPRGRQKRINRELVGLFTNGMTGNDALPQTCFERRRYCSDGKAAGLVERQNKTGESIYWPATMTRHGRLWYAWEIL